MQFNVNVAFTNAQLEILYATGTNIVVAKPSAGGGSPNVASLVFKGMNANSITWQEEYGIYASTQALSNGAKLRQLSNVNVPAADDQTYTLQDSGTINGPFSGGSPGSFTLYNQYSAAPYMTVGLYQNANVNGIDILNSAISAAPVILNSTAVMTPFTTVYIWLQSNVTGNCVVTNVTSPMSRLVFGSSQDTISVAYDSASGKFLPVPSRGVSISAQAVNYLESISTVEALLV